jgi:hypothetical protein
MPVSYHRPTRPSDEAGRAGADRLSGWNYGGWRRTFYPRGLRQSDELSYASRQVGTIEINGTHYSLQRPDSFARWYDETPKGFIFAVKGSRYITHMMQLRDIKMPLANFFASGVLRLEEKLGPFCGNSRPGSGSMPNACTISSRCCRAIPRRRQRSPNITTGAWPAAPGRGTITSGLCATQ